MSRTVRSVAWERSLGQVAQIGLTVVVLLAVPSPLRSSVPLIGATAVALAIVAVVLLRRRMAPARRLPARMLHAVVDDLAAIVRAPRVGVGILLASVLVVLGHAGDLPRRCSRRRGRGVRRSEPPARPGRASGGVPSPPASPDGAPARASPRGPSRSPDSARPRGSPSRSSMASSPWSRRSPARWCWWPGGVPDAGLLPRSLPLHARWPMAERPYTVLSCAMSLDGYCDSASEERLRALQRRGPRPRRRRAGRLRRHPRRRRDRPQRQPSAGGAQRGTDGRPSRSGPAPDTAEGDRHRPREARPGGAVLHGRRHPEARLLCARHRRGGTGPARAASRRSSTPGAPS